MTPVEMMLSAVRAQICGGERVLYGTVTEEELKQLYALSKAQDLAHIVATELDARGLLPKESEIGGKFHKQQMLAVLRYERINYELEAVCRLFEEREIVHMPLKGSVLRRYYPEPWMRTSADIDLLVEPKALERAAEALVEALGYRMEPSGTDYDLSLFSPSGVHLELHYDTIHAEQTLHSDAVLSDIWAYSAPETGWKYRYLATDDMFYFYHIAHTVKHFAGNGCGARFFLDLWILNHRVELDRSKRELLLKKGGLDSFAHAAEELSEVWFSGRSHSELTRTMERYIFSGGIYGSETARVVNRQIRKGGKLGYAMSRIFLPYGEMRVRYRSLDRNKWLLPFYHLHRWLRILFGGGTARSVRELRFSADIENEQKETIRKMLRDLGLSEE